MRSLSASLSAAFLAIFLLCCLGAKQNETADRIGVIPNQVERRVEITIDGQPFTAYIWPERLAKPVLYPLRSAKGTIITRGFPLEPRPGERADHPHQIGFWLNYENVNGIDFWGNSEAIKPQDAPKMGTIRHRSITAAKGGPEHGELEIEADWLTYDKKVLLKEHTRFAFRGGPNFRSVDRITTLQAQNEKVVFADAKDGMLGLRVTRALEMPSDMEKVFTDASGHATTVPKMDNTGVTGMYLTSEGKKGDDAWSTRARWCNLSGHIGDEPVTITILDHPANPDFPTFWHARGYGLFAANPLGRKIFSNGKEPALNLTLAPNQSVTFRYRVLISTEIASPESTESAYKDFAAAYH
jgi:methane monooxygenase PmoA-like